MKFWAVAGKNSLELFRALLCRMSILVQLKYSSLGLRDRKRFGYTYGILHVNMSSTIVYVSVGENEKIRKNDR